MVFSNETNISFDLELIYLKIGSSWTLDTIYLYFVTFMGLFGFVTNIVNIFVLFQIENSNFNTYLQAYSINSCIISFIGGLLVIPYSPRYIPFFSESYAQIIRCKLFTFVGPSLYMFGNILDILISLERLSTVYFIADKITKLAKPVVVCFVILFISFFINSPLYFVFRIRSSDEFYQEYVAQSTTFTYCGQTDFFRQLYSFPLFILYILIMFLRDIITLILEIVVSSICIYHYRKHQKRLMRLTRPTHVSDRTINHLRRIEEGGQKLLKMTICMSILSILSHLIVFFTHLFPMISTSLLNSFNYFYFVFLTIASFGLKHISNFLLFYLFNSNFRQKLRRFIFK